MSLYDDATLICLAKGAAGKDGVVYNIKPEEKLKPTELITNGGFDTDSVWIKNTDAGQEATISGGKGRLVGDGSAFTNLQQNDVFEANKVYRVSLEVEIREGELKVQSNGYDANIGEVSTSGNHSFYFTGVSGSPNIVLGRKAPSVAFDIEVDNVSVKEVEQKALDFTFTRGSNLTATRVGPSGYIEKGRENLVEHSNDFSKWSNASGLYGYTLTSGQSGYDGSTNATLVDKTTTDHNGYIFNTATTISHNGVFTYSIYARDGGDDDSSIHLYIGDSSPKGNIRVNLNTGAQLNSTSIATKIEPITGEAGDTDRWYRISFTNDANLNDKPRIQVRNAAGDQDSAGKMFIQNAQVEVGLVATEYIESGATTGKAGILEDSPRFDYLDVTCPHLLMEPNRVNKVQYSEYFSGWPTISNVTLTDNDAKSPEGLNNATKLLASGSGTVNHQVDSNSFGITSGGGAVTASIFAKKGNTDFVRLRLNGTTSGSNTGSRAWFDLENGEVGEVDADATATITDMGDGWYRCTITEAGNTNDTGLRLQVFINESDGQTSWTADGDEYIYIYGAQFEEGSYATSYIPNHGLSGGATRNVEQTDVSNLQSNGIITDTQGTFFIDIDDYSTNAVQWGILSRDFYFGLRAAFFTSTMTVYQRILNTQTTIRNINSSDVASLGTTTRRKLALSWNGTSLITSINGTSFDDTIDSTLASQLDKIRRANWGTTKVSTDQLLMFDKQLTKEELNELTSIS